MELISQKMRALAPEMDPLRLGTGWKKEDLGKPQIIIESTFGDSHPGSGHLDRLAEAVRQGVSEAGGHGAGMRLERNPQSIGSGAGNRSLLPRGFMRVLLGAMLVFFHDRGPQREPGPVCAALPPSL